VRSKANYIEINRDQLGWCELDINRLVPPQHPARAIWALSERFDLSGFEQRMKNHEGDGGRPCWPPRLLFCVWIYAYSQGIASARAVERMMGYEPGLRWLCATEIINHHTLSDFRVSGKTELENLMAQLIAILDREELIDLRTVAHDGTKIHAKASKFSFHRQRTLQDRVKVARRVVRQLRERAEQEEAGQAADARKEAAEQRAAQQRLQRMEQSLQKLRREQAKTSPGKRDEMRVSVSEPDARKMKQPDGGWAPSYNVQISTDVKHRIIVGVRVTDARSDVNELRPGVAVVRRWCKRKPRRLLVDGGYASRDNVAAMSAQKIELIAPWKDDTSRQAGALAVTGRDAAFAPSTFQATEDGMALLCPAGKLLKVLKEGTHHGQRYRAYRAEAVDCETCPQCERCCGKQRSGPRQIEQVQETPAMQAYLKRMQQPEIRHLYKKRSEVGEFPNVWIKSHWGLRQFSVWGKVRTAKEAIWAALAYNVQQWTRLRWSPAV
jgi:transposase